MVLGRALLVLVGCTISGAIELAVVRPFASRAETVYVRKSFDIWNTYMPCNATPSVPVDLYLIYSRSFEHSAEALSSVTEVAEGFRNQTAKWHNCFRALHILSANLTAEEDIYNPRGAQFDKNWVRGPNEVFRYVLRSFVGSSYEAIFQMELDSVPKRSNWLDQFQREVVEYPKAAIRGSPYRGDNWDSFLPQMPQTLISHINGNAIYFVQHPFLAWLSTQVNADRGTDKDSVAYDVRVAEMCLDSQSGVWPEGRRALEDLVPVGQQVYSDDSLLIGNYANTLLNESFDGGEYIAHVAIKNIYKDINASRITLAVSHFSNHTFAIWESSLNTIHPFREILVLTDPLVAPDEAMYNDRTQVVQTSQGNTTVRYQRALEPAYLSLCELADMVETEFFAYSDTYHVISSPIAVLMDGERPVLPALQARSIWCAGDPKCVRSLNQAYDLFGVNLTDHFDKFDTLFYTNLTRSFCEEWKTVSGSGFEQCLQTQPPSADDYFAWLISQDNETALDGIYTKENREYKGWRRWSELHTAHPPDLRACMPQESQASAPNISSCAVYVEQPDLCTPSVGCMWKPMFQSGKCVSFRADHPSIVGLKPAAVEDPATNTSTTTVTTGTNTTTVTETTTTVTSTTGTTTTGTTTTGTTTTGTTITETSTTSTTYLGQPTQTTTTTSTTTTTIPILASIGTVLIPINTTRVTKENVGAVLHELRTAVDAVKNGSNADGSNFIGDSDVRIELTEESGMTLPSEPSQPEKVALLSAIRDGRCGELPATQCDVQEPNSTVGLKAEEGAVIARRLQVSTGYRLEFVVFIVIRDASDLATTQPIDTPEFAATFATAAVAYLSNVSSANVTSNASNATATPSLLGGTLITMLKAVIAAAPVAANASNDSNATTTAPPMFSFSTPVANTLTVINVVLPENAPADFSAVQNDMTNATSLVQAISVASGSGELVLAAPVVDLCLGRTCGGNGVCSTGICTCDEGWTGNNCLIALPPPPAPAPVAPSPGPVAPPPLAEEESSEGSANGAAVGAAVAANILVCGAVVVCLKAAHKRRKQNKEKNMVDDNEKKEVPVAVAEEDNDSLFWVGEGQSDPPSAGEDGGDIFWPGESSSEEDGGVNSGAATAVGVAAAGAAAADGAAAAADDEGSLIWVGEEEEEDAAANGDEASIVWPGEEASANGDEASIVWVGEEDSSDGRVPQPADPGTQNCTPGVTPEESEQHSTDDAIWV